MEFLYHITNLVLVIVVFSPIWILAFVTLRNVSTKLKAGYTLSQAIKSVFKLSSSLSFNAWETHSNSEKSLDQANLMKESNITNYTCNPKYSGCVGNISYRN